MGERRRSRPRSCPTTSAVGPQPQLRRPELHSDVAPASDGTARGSRHRERWTQASAAVLVLAAAVALLVWKLWEAKPQVNQVADQLVLTGLTAEVSPSTGGCGTKFVFTGKAEVRGGSGRVTYRWIKPDGATTDPTTATVVPRSRTDLPNFEYTLRGPGRVSGDAVVIVSKPVQLRSAPVHIDYVC